MFVIRHKDVSIRVPILYCCKNTPSTPILFLSVSKLKTPLLILHSKDDHIVPFHMGQEVISTRATVCVCVCVCVCVWCVRVCWGVVVCENLAVTQSKTRWFNLLQNISKARCILGKELSDLLFVDDKDAVVLG